uniref:hypothetical protein n=1 Tax=Streptomyces flavofungini TaxID=68200 RepID=UPI0034DFFE4C
PSLSSWRRARQERAVLDAARYRVAWHPASTEGAPVLDGTWLAVTTKAAEDGCDEATDVLDALRGHGAVIERLVLDASHLDRDHLTETLRAAVESAAADGAPGISGVLCLLPLADPAHPDGLPTGFALGVV